MPLPLVVSCFSKIQIGFTFLVPAHPGGPGQRAIKRVCVCVIVRSLQWRNQGSQCRWAESVNCAITMEFFLVFFGGGHGAKSKMSQNGME